MDRTISKPHRKLTIYRFAETAETHHVPVVHFKKKEKKEETARPYLETAAREGKDRVVLIGIVKERTCWTAAAADR